MMDFLDTAWFAIRMHLSGTWLRYATAFVGVCVLAVLWWAYIAPPASATLGIVTVPSGKSLSGIAADLQSANVIRSPFALKVALFLTGHDRDIQAGAYEFKKPESVFTVAHRIATGDTQVVPTRVTLTEGMASFDMANAIAEAIPGFDAAQFEELAAAHEGYLFPDTYFFLPTVTPEQAVARLTSNFTDRTSGVADLQNSTHSLADIVTMASIVEREARTPEDQRIVAGILWHRIAIHMRLQVDAVFSYLKRQSNYQPTADDLATTSPYNTYKNYGLPPGPISNPGLGALDAAANPTKSDYLYYISDTEGIVHYAKTFEEHQKNIQTYL
jgi:UPF0755 protein